MSGQETRHPLVRLAGDFIVIVIGVLVALGVDSWAQDREDRARELVYLEQLEIDLRQTLSEADTALSREEDYSQMVRRLMEALDEEPLPARDSLARWAENTLRSSRFQPVSATVDALIETGDVALVENEQIRRLIVVYRDQVRQAISAYDLFDEADLDAIASINRRWNRSASLRDISPARYPVNWESIAADPVFRGDLYTHQIAVRSRRGSIRDLRSALTPLLDALGAELDRRGRSTGAG